jgi:hypothetical protein
MKTGAVVVLMLAVGCGGQTSRGAPVSMDAGPSTDGDSACGPAEQLCNVCGILGCYAGACPVHSCLTQVMCPAGDALCPTCLGMACQELSAGGTCPPVGPCASTEPPSDASPSGGSPGDDDAGDDDANAGCPSDKYACLEGCAGTYVCLDLSLPGMVCNPVCQAGWACQDRACAPMQ